MFGLNQEKTIKIKCQGADVASIDDLYELQGNLKTNTDEGYEWQKGKILTYGYSFPMDVWKDETGKLWEIDGHRRLRTLRRMRGEGYIIPQIPINYVFCKDRKEAKDKVLLAIAQPEEITNEGFEEFISEEGYGVDEDYANDLLALDDEVEEPTVKKPEPGKKKPEEKPKKEPEELKCEKCENFHNRSHDESVA
jgi:hypothetical protein